MSCYKLEILSTKLLCNSQLTFRSICIQLSPALIQHTPFNSYHPTLIPLSSPNSHHSNLILLSSLNSHPTLITQLSSLNSHPALIINSPQSILITQFSSFFHHLTPTQLFRLFDQGCTAVVLVFLLSSKQKSFSSLFPAAELKIGSKMFQFILIK